MYDIEVGSSYVGDVGLLVLDAPVVGWCRGILKLFNGKARVNNLAKTMHEEDHVLYFSLGK